MLPNTIRRMGELRQGQRKWLEINLSTQRLIAWEGGKPVYAVIVSTGKPATPTYSGVYSIYRKQHPERMRGRGYDIPNVPRSEEHTSELQSLTNLVCRLLLEKKKNKPIINLSY